jgi:hemerythrin-like domain-containing protein
LDPAASWQIEHAHFDRLLAFLEKQLAVLRSGELPNWELMCQVTNYICHFGARYHHARENVAFWYILQRNPAMSSTIDRLLQEHADIATQGEELEELLSRTIADPAAAGANIQDVLTAFIAAYRAHLAAEEEKILPYAEQNLSATEWDSVTTAAPVGPDPYVQYGASRHTPTFGSEAEVRYQAIVEMIQKNRLARLREYSVASAADCHEYSPVGRRKVAGFAEVPYPAVLVREGAVSRRLLVRQAIGLLALVLAYLQYHYFDVQLQLMSLPSNLAVLLP